MSFWCCAYVASSTKSTSDTIMMQFEDDDNCPEMEAFITDKSQPFVTKTEADVNDVTEHPRDDKPRP